jgi:YbbR domain-containing protein
MAYHPFRHLGLKVLAIALAVVLWLTVAGEQIVERSLRVPLEFRNQHPELVIVGDTPASIEVRVRGSSGILSRLDPGDVIAMIDLIGTRPGTRLFHLRNDEVRVPYGVSVVQVAPATLSLDVEKVATRTVPVVPATEGDPAPGFVVGRISSEPATVEIAGPESHVRQTAEATTEPVDVEGARERKRDIVTVGVIDSTVRLVHPQRATVIVEIGPAPVEADVSDVPVRWRNLGQGLQARVSPSLTVVSIRGQREKLSAIRSETIDAWVDLAGLGPGRYNLRVQIDPSEDFGIRTVTPGVVSVTIK